MKKSEGTMEEQMRQDATAEACPKCNAELMTPCAYPNWRFRDCPQRAERLAMSAKPFGDNDR